MHFFIASVSEKLVVKHHILPGDGFIEFKLNLIDLVFGLHVDEKVCVVKDSINEQVGRILGVVYFAC